jgi:hypothetical protein
LKLEDFNRTLSDEKTRFKQEIQKEKCEKLELANENSLLKEKHQKRLIVFKEFLNKMNFKIDLSQRYLNENIGSEFEDGKLIEVYFLIYIRKSTKIYQYT